MIKPGVEVFVLSPLGEVGPDLRADLRWQLIERILQTGPFQKSSRLPDLLRYLAERSIHGHPEELTEQRIGIAVFGKPADYSPAEDSAVRVHVRQLRLRLHEYFACEGRDEPFVVDIPKGAYALVFRPILSAAVSENQSSSLPLLSKVQKNRFTIQQILPWSLSAVTIICALLWSHTVTKRARAPVPWPLNSVIRQNEQTCIVLADSNSMLRLLGEKQISLEEYLSPGFQQNMIPPHMSDNVARLVNYISDSQLTSYADVLVSSTLTRLAGPRADHLIVRSARDLNRRDLEQGNYVFVGSQISNPWVSLFQSKLNFEVVEEGVGGKMFFRNKKPQPGEMDRYQGLEHTGSAGEDYATIALLPSSSGQGSALILQGLRQEGTEALGVLLADGVDRAKLKKALGIGEDARKPVYFEALIRTVAVAGAPVSNNIVATRIIQP